MYDTHMYILADDDMTPIACPDTLEWGRWMEAEKFKHAMKWYSDDQTIEVSTVFLGLDHNFRSDGPPILWETMIFGGPEDQYQDRYSSYGAAVAGHECTVLHVKHAIATGDFSW